MTSPTSKTSRNRLAGAFTLIEVLLALTVMVLLVGAAAVGLSGGVEREYLDEGAARFETTLRWARAQAAQTGRTLRLHVDEQGACALLWEPDPLQEPGVFVPYTTTWSGTLPNQMVRVVSSVLSEVEVYRPSSEASAFTNDPDAHPAPEAITFYPDGACDSAVVELRSTDLSDPRTAVIEIDGINALFSTRIMTRPELDEYRRPATRTTR